MPKNIPIGIDLGTTYSVMAFVDEDGKTQIIPNFEGERLTPSVVYRTGSTFIAGQSAKDAGLADPKNTIEFVKREMGMPDWRFTHNAQSFTAPEISAEILKKLKNDAGAFLDAEVTDAVITVPADFGEPQRRATQKAAELAELTVLRLINEPTAAAIAYGIDKNQQPETVLVYDLGGGTFDVTICHVDGQNISVIVTDGDPFLGGKDFDDRLIDYAAKEFQKQHDFDPREDEEMLGDLRDRIVRVKHQLTTLETAQLMVMGAGKRANVEITRQAFDDLGRRRMSNTELILNRALRDANLGLNDIDRVLLVGGATRMPMVKRTLSAYLGRSIENSDKPDEVVALGAAVLAMRESLKAGGGTISEEARERIADIRVFDVVSHSLGIQATSMGSNQPINRIIIPRNSRVPCESKQVFSTDREGATSVRLIVYQGESTVISEALRVGEFVLSGLPAGRPRGAKIEVTIRCNDNGIVEVEAKDVQTGTQANIAVNYDDLT